MKTFKTLALISLLSTLASVVNAGQVPVLHCAGTDPFWVLNTDSKGFLSFGDPTEVGSKRFYSKTTMRNAVGTNLEFAFEIEAKDMLNNTLSLSVVETSCNDGMSDIVYPKTALVDVDGFLYIGCCQ